MALIRSLSEGHANVHLNRTQVDATVQTFIDSELGRIVHLATYGSDGRQSEPKVSQVIQLDRTNGKELLKILTEAFGQGAS